MSGKAAVNAKIIKQTFDPAIPVDSLTAHPDNPNRGDLAAITASIQAQDFFGGIIVQKSTRHILAGNHRWMAVKQLGRTSPM